MNQTAIQYGVLGAVGGYAVGAIGGHFMSPKYKHHIGAGLALIGLIVGYQYGASMPATTMPAATTTAMPAATPAPAPAATA